MGEFPTAPSPARTDDTVIVAGGTDLFVQKPEELLEREICLVSRMPGLDRIRVDGSTLRIGAAVSLEEFRLSPLVLDRFPSMKGDLLLHSSTILRNKATLAGNVVNASPIGDMTIILLALDASLVIQNREGKSREVALREFYKGYKKFDLACGEILSEIAIPPLDGAHFNFEKISNRTILDIAAVNSACVIKFDPSGAISELRISAGGVAPVPMLIPGLDLLHGRKPNSSAADAAAEIAMAAVTPIDDIRGTAQYKRLLLGNLVRLHFDSFSKMEARS